MTERKYSVTEIDRMRSACQTLFVCRQGTSIIHLAQMREEGENMLRTYLTAGTDPDELCAFAKKEQEKYDQNTEKMRQTMQEFKIRKTATVEEAKKKKKDAWWVPPLLITCAICVVVGVGMALYTDNVAWLVMAIPGVIFLGG